MPWPPPSRTKYGAQKQALPCSACGYRHDSAKEARRCGLLELAQRAGAITHLLRQVRFRLEVNGQHIADYIADFTYDEAGTLVVEDSKSSHTRTLPVYRLKAKLMRAIHGVTIRET